MQRTALATTSFCSHLIFQSEGKEEMAKVLWKNLSGGDLG